MNQKGRLAWELYLKMGTSSDSFSLLQLIANDCYKVTSLGTSGVSRSGPRRQAPRSLPHDSHSSSYRQDGTTRGIRYGITELLNVARLQLVSRLNAAACGFRWASSTMRPKPLMRWRNWTRAPTTGKARGGPASAFFSSSWPTRSRGTSLLSAPGVWLHKVATA